MFYQKKGEASRYQTGIFNNFMLGLLKGQLGVPLTVYPWYLLCSPGILGDYNE